MHVSTERPLPVCVSLTVCHLPPSIGHLLMDVLVDTLRYRGTQRLVGLVGRENLPMRRLAGACRLSCRLVAVGSGCPADRLRLRTWPLSTAAHIAVVDDEPDIIALLSQYLAGHGYRVTPLNDGHSLQRLMASDPPALVLLDLGLPGEDGFAIARQLHERWHCGLIIVTGRGDAVDKVVGLEVGADDYVTKPFDLRELLARIKAVLRRIAPADTYAQGNAVPDSLRFAGWALDIAARRLVAPQGHEVLLTTGEFELLLALAKHPGRVLSRDFLLGQTHGREAGPFDRTIDVQVSRLRRKLGDDADDPKLIKSVRSAGYILVSDTNSGHGT